MRHPDATTGAHVYGTDAGYKAICDACLYTAPERKRPESRTPISDAIFDAITHNSWIHR